MSDYEKAKPSLKHLMVLKVMVEEGFGMASSSSYGMSSRTVFFIPKTFDRAPDEFNDWFDINKCQLTATKMYHWGWLGYHKKPEFDDVSKSLKGYHYSTRFVGATRLAKEYWASEGQSLYEKLKAKEDNKNAAVNRLAIISAKKKTGYGSSTRNAVALVEITRETSKRVYFTLVKFCDDSIFAFNVYDGNSQESYTSIDKIYRDDVTEEFFDQLVKVEGEIEADKKQIKSQMDDEIAEITSRYKDRSLQKDAEYADMLAPLIGYPDSEI